MTPSSLLQACRSRHYGEEGHGTAGAGGGEGEAETAGSGGGGGGGGQADSWPEWGGAGSGRWRAGRPDRSGQGEAE